MTNMDGFLFGVATAAAQVEGGYVQDGRGPSVWDYYSEKGLIKNGHTCYECCDSYNRLEEDLALIKELGINSYRFSISWSRIQPLGSGAVNEKGIAYYNRLIDGLLEMGVKPMVTLFHWDLPLPLYEAGGFLNRDIVERFAEYGRIVAENFGDRVELFAVFNEPMVVLDFMYVQPVGGGAPPKTNQQVFEALHNLLLCNAAATQALRTCSAGKVQVGMVNCSHLHIPLHPQDAELARQATFDVGELMLNNTVTFWDPIVFGKYDERIIRKFHIDTSFIQPGDMEKICCKPDFMGCNVYAGQCVTDDGNGGYKKVPSSKNAVYDDCGAEIMGTVSCMEWGLRFLQERYGLPIYITENGCWGMDWKTEQGTVEDPMRVDYINRYFSHLMMAKDAGVDIRGYFVWTLMDNFEWSSGFTRRFGLVYVDFETQERIPKSSYYNYAKLIAKYKNS